MECQLTERQQKYYDLGKKASTEYETEKDAQMSMDMETLESLCTGYYSNLVWFHAGFVGREPEYVHAIRYGAIPADGYSINHADGTAEKGVSCVKIVRNADDNDYQSVYDVTQGWQGIGKIVVAGWYVGGSGSDGEPLLIDAVEEKESN